MSAEVLKLIALLSMLIDHIGAALVSSPSQLYTVCRKVGRLAFPIFAFFIVEGFIHTKNIKKYLFRLGIFALLSEIPYDLAFHDRFFDFSGQNVLFTFFIAIVMLHFMRKYDSWISSFVIIFLACLVAFAIKCDYSYMGILLIAVLYLYREKKFEFIKYFFASIIIVSQFPAMLAFIPIHFYNNLKGRLNLKYLFYIFYPAHLLLLFFIRKYIFT